MFDARVAKALKAGEHIVIEEAPGLRLVASSVRTWIYRYKSPADGNMRQVKLGRWPAMGFPAALVAWEQVRGLRDSGVDPAQQRREERRQASSEVKDTRYTVRRAADEFLLDYQGTVAPKTYREAARLLRRDIDPIADRPASSITRADAFDLLDAMRDRPVVAGNLRQLLGAVWDRALDSGRIPPEVPNWWRLILRGKLPSKGKTVAGKKIGVSKRVLTEAELAVLIPWLPNFSRDIQDALTLYLWTGCRGAEIVAMQAEEVTEEPDGMWWTIPKERLKMRRNPLTTDLRVPLVGRALATVKRRLSVHETGYVFPSSGASGHIEQKAVGVAVWTHMPQCTLRPYWSRPRLPVSGWAPHDLRRTARTLLASLGCPSEIGELILGHQLPGIQSVYNRHHHDAERRLWLTTLAKKLEALG